MKKTLKRGKGTNRLAVWAFLLILFPAYFWFTVFVKYQLGVGLLFDFWNYFYEDYLEFFLLLLPIPAFIIGWIALIRSRKRKSGALLSTVSILSSVISGFAWWIAAQRPS